MMMQLMIYLVAYGEICGAYGDFMKFGGHGTGGKSA